MQNKVNMDELLRIQGMDFAYPQGRPVLCDIHLHIQAGETVCLLGGSGSGKTTLLRLVQGLLLPDQGTIQVPGTLGVVSQQYELFPHLDARANIELVLRRSESLWQRMQPSQSARARADQLLSQVGLDTAAGQYPATLSGGQRQRVALAQALAQDAPLVLMDEPFGALDEAVRAQLQDLMIRLQQEYQFGLLFVTHDVEEALYLGNRIHILRPGADGAVCETYPVVDNARPVPEIKQSEVFFKQLQALRAYYYRQAELHEHPQSMQAALDRGLIDETILATLEQQAHEIWVISRELRQDGHNPLIHAAVKANLAAGKRYRYIIPEQDPVAAQNRIRLEQQFADSQGQISFDTLPDGTSLFFFGEIVLYDPLSPNPSGFTYLHGDERGLLVRLPEAFIRAHVDLVENEQ